MRMTGDDGLCVTGVCLYGRRDDQQARNEESVLVSLLGPGCESVGVDGSKTISE